MVLTTAGALISFLLLIAPGIVANHYFDRRRAPREESGFVEAGWITLYGTTFSTIAHLILLAGTQYLPGGDDWIDELESWVLYAVDTSGSPPTDLIVPIGFLLTGLALGIGLVYSFDRLFGSVVFGPVLRVHSGWTEAIQYHDLDIDEPLIVATVWTEDGHAYRGIVEDYSDALSMEDREITLVNEDDPVDLPVVRLANGVSGPSEQREHIEESRLVIPGSQILKVGFIYASRDDNIASDD